MTSSSSPSLNDIAFQISGLTYNISKYFEQSNLPPPSFAADGPTRFPASASADIQSARTQLLELTLNLHNLILGPEERIRTQTAEFVAPATLRWISHFKIAEHIPYYGTITYSELAEAASVPETQLKRILRYTMLNGYFSEVSPGVVAHSAMSLLLANNPSIRDYVGHSIGFSYPVSTKMVEMTERYKGSDAKNETAFNVAYETPLPMFAWMKGEPEHSERFGRLMGAMRQAPIYSVSHLVDGYDWNGLGGAKVVDVGGSLGHTSLAIAEKNPEISFVVQDLEEVVEQGKAKAMDGKAEKLEFMAHDFFKEQPIKDADVYLLRQILHDWPDAEATTILKKITASMKKDARIVIMDQVVPPPGLLPNAQEKAGRVIDLVVMSHFNGKQRDLDDWMKIFAAVDDRLVLSKLVIQPGSVLSILELQLQDPSPVIEDPVAESVALEDNGVPVDTPIEQSATNGSHHEQGDVRPAGEVKQTAVNVAADAITETTAPLDAVDAEKESKDSSASSLEGTKDIDHPEDVTVITATA